MKKYITDLLTNNSYYLKNQELSLYSNNLKSEYFILADYTLEEFKDFFETDLTGKIINKFTELVNKEMFKNLKKNTSLYLLVKVENLEKAYENLKNQMLLIEEDIYYFRKFVILYTESSISEFKKTTSIEALYNYLSEKMLDFEKNMFFNDTYFVTMELAIKLPFFKVNESEKEYQTIENKYKDEKDNIDEQLLILLNREDVISVLSDVNEDSQLLIEIFKLFSEE